MYRIRFIDANKFNDKILFRQLTALRNANLPCMASTALLNITLNILIRKAPREEIKSKLFSRFISVSHSTLLPFFFSFSFSVLADDINFVRCRNNYLYNFKISDSSERYFFHTKCKRIHIFVSHISFHPFSPTHVLIDFTEQLAFWKINFYSTCLKCERERKWFYVQIVNRRSSLRTNLAKRRKTAFESNTREWFVRTLFSIDLHSVT